FLVSIVNCLGQEISFRDLKIEISMEQPAVLIGCSVTLNQLHRPEDVLQSSSEFGDSYVFRHIPTGDYVARVFNPSGALLKEELVRVGGGESLVRINLPQ